MFEATLHAADPDRQRAQRLILAAAIAVGSTSAVFASVWTLERFGIERIPGPMQQLEILQFSLLPAPKLIEPPPPPAIIESEVVEHGDPSPDILEEPMPAAAADDDDDLDEAPRPSNVLTQPDTRRGGIPGVVGGIGGNPNGTGFGKIPGGNCTGPDCKIGDPLATKPAAAPAEVEFSALRCLACADPDQAALRKTVVSGQKRSGSVTVKFCVDQTGRVESNSIKVSRSFGVAAVDQITTSTIKQWRFSPLKIDGKPRRACSRAVFNIRFD